MGYVCLSYDIKTYHYYYYLLLLLLLLYTWIFETGLAKISTHFTTWQFKTIKLIQRPIKSLYLTPGSKLMVPRSIPTTPNLK